MSQLAFLHTSPVHVATFTRLMGQLSPETSLRHLTRADLLEAAQQPEADLTMIAAELRRELTTLAAAVPGEPGADLVICTCSTLGALAEAINDLPAPVWRVDRPMARQAVRLGRRPLVVASIASTLAPTLALLQEEAAGAGLALEPQVLLMEELWPLFTAGRLRDYAEAAAAAIEAQWQGETAVVLAQASLAPAGDLVSLPMPVAMLSSPRSCAEAATVFLATAGATAGHRRASAGASAALS